ncbi:MAG: TRAP transporter fused permease subunit [Pirellulaceae bacterium]|nr:TRAP transporter fused permease subunit [Pirellulaceae bacterium]
MFDRIIKKVVLVLGVLVCLYTLVAVNYAVLQPQSSLAIFVGIGLVLCYLEYPLDKRWKDVQWLRYVDVGLALLSAACFGYIFVQTEPWSIFQQFWAGGESLGSRASQETTLDFWVGVTGLFVVLEATRRSIGWIVPALALLFVFHCYYAANLPDWLLPHPGQSVQLIVSNTVLQDLGVLGKAAGVMFNYVFLFVVFGAFLEMSGATQFIIDFSEKIFGRSPGGPAKVSVLGSGLMGSLSGSAVANAVTTGSFTIPMMRNSGFKPDIAGGITAAAAAGGALVPPVMGAGAYMMLEFVKRDPGQPEVTFLEIAKSAVIPALLYYFSLWMIVHFFAGRLGATAVERTDKPQRSIWQFEGIVFFSALGILIGLLVLGSTPFKAVTGSLVVILALSTMRPQLKLGTGPRILAIAAFLLVTLAHQFTDGLADKLPESMRWVNVFLASSWESPGTGELTGRAIFDSILASTFIGMFGLLIFGLFHRVWRPEVIKAFSKAAKNGISLVAASACVGIIIGIVQTTPMANEFGAAIKNVVEHSRLLALIGIMFCSIVLGMGVPSVVCYLLMATLMGALLGDLGVDPLAAHMFIFYFGMMSMVTPPVALAAYASASIANAKIMTTALAAFRFSLVGFTLPFMFVYRTELLLMPSTPGGDLDFGFYVNVVIAVAVAIVGVIALAAGLTGFFRSQLSFFWRVLLFVSAVLLLAPEVGGATIGWIVNAAGGAIFLVIAIVNWRRQPQITSSNESDSEAATDG